MQHIETVVVPSGGSSSITFMAVGDIPSEYTDLVIKVSSRSTRTAGVDSFNISFNGSTSNFSYRRLAGSGSIVFSTAANERQIALVSDNANTANTFANTEIYIPNYRSTLAKSVSTDSVSENNATEGYQSIYATLWNPAVNVPITSISLTMSNGNLVEHSSASLYGVLAGSDGIVSVS